VGEEDVKDEGEASAASVSGSQGVQAGDSNVQVNLSLGDHRPDSAPLDAASLGDLSPHAAVTRIRRMRHNDAVLVLARAEVDDAAKVLAVLLEADEPLAVALLADINRSKAEVLTATAPPFESGPHWLRQLPEAAEAIGNCAVQMKWAGTGDAGRLERAEPTGGTEGYRRVYRGGWVYWSQESGAQAITGDIAQYHEAEGGISKIGFPVDAEVCVRSSSGTSGYVQSFQSVYVYASEHGVYAVGGDILGLYRSEGTVYGWLGFPVGEQTQVSSWDDPMQSFEGGAIHDTESGVFAVRSALIDYLEPFSHLKPRSGDGLEIGQWFYPLAPEVDAQVSPYGTTGLVQRFRASFSGWMIIYSSDEYGIRHLYDPIREYHARLGGTSSWLGFPKSDLFGQIGLSSEDDIYYQDFEGGMVFVRGGRDGEPVAVPAASMELISRDHETKQRLGLPISEDQPIGADGSGRIQFFENGNVTLRSGKRQIWLRP
jgi:hypothetical protein